MDLVSFILNNKSWAIGHIYSYSQITFELNILIAIFFPIPSVSAFMVFTDNQQMLSAYFLMA